MLYQGEYMIKIFICFLFFIISEDINSYPIFTKTIEMSKEEKIESWKRIIKEEVLKYKNPNINYEMIVSIIEVESSWNPNAISYLNCRGLMQIHEDTFQLVKQWCPERFSTYTWSNDVFNPYVNISIGTMYLNWLFYKKNNCIESSVTSYFWGPSSINTTKEYSDKVLTVYYEKKEESNI